MKYFKKTINLLFFLWCVLAITVSSMWIVVVIITSFIKGCGYYTINEWCVWFILTPICILIWNRISDWWKPLFKPEEFDSF